MNLRWYTHDNKYRKPCKKDPQRHLLYSLERKFIGSCVFTKTEKKAILMVVRHACNKYKVRHPKVVFGRDKQRLFGYCDDEKLWLNTSFHGQNLVTALHELAHWIVEELEEDEYETHGPEFAAVYMHLLAAYKLLPEVAFRHFAEESGLKIADYQNPYI